MTDPFPALISIEAKYAPAMRIRVIDLETTGLEAGDHVVEIAAWDLAPFNGGSSIILVDSVLVKPPVPIPPVASAVHHITDEDVADARAWEQVYPRFVDDTVDAYAAHNSRFDGQWLAPIIGKPLIDTYRAAIRLWPNAPSHSNQALRYWLKPPGINRGDAAKSHRARCDAYVTAHILDLILQQPKVTLDGLVLCSQRPALLSRVGFGKHRSKLWSEVDTGYLEWVLNQDDMQEDVKYTAKIWLERHARAAREAAAARETDAVAP